MEIELPESNLPSTFGSMLTLKQNSEMLNFILKSELSSPIIVNLVQISHFSREPSWIIEHAKVIYTIPNHKTQPGQYNDFVKSFSKIDLSKVEVLSVKSLCKENSEETSCEDEDTFDYYILELLKACKLQSLKILHLNGINTNQTLLDYISSQLPMLEDLGLNGCHYPDISYCNDSISFEGFTHLSILYIEFNENDYLDIKLPAKLESLILHFERDGFPTRSPNILDIVINASVCQSLKHVQITCDSGFPYFGKLYLYLPAKVYPQSMILPENIKKRTSITQITRG